MIYKNSYFAKELRRAYVENKISSKREFSFALFLGIFSFAVHFVLQSLTKSVLSDAFPEFMQPSYFSSIYLYINIAFVFHVVYFAIYYEYLSFAEIRKNRWYLLVKMGYEPISMILSKLLARLLSIVFVYSLGFLFTILLTIFLKYTFVYEYFLALYITGLIDLIVVCLVSMAASLYLKNLTNARYFVFISAVMVILFKVFSGYYAIVSNRVLMQNIYNLFDFKTSLYLPLAALVIFICITGSIFGAGNIAKYYSLPSCISDFKMPDGVSIALANPKTGEPDLDSKNRAYKEKKQSKLLNFIATTMLVLVVFGVLAFNVMVILISTSQPGKEVTIMGTIPYIFKSNTMEPDIMENDLAYFEKLDSQAPVEIGQIVLLKDKDVTYIERVVSKNSEKYVVDIDNYPAMSQKEAMRKTVERPAIYGIYTGTNRWLGALILFANTMIGRLIFLLVPGILLFFYKPIFGTIRNNSKSHVRE